MFIYTVIFFLFVSSINMNEIQSGFAQEYLNKNYIPLIRQTHFISNRQVDSKLSCVMGCLNEDACSISVFNQTSYQCMFYNTFPIIDQELLPDNNIIVFVFQQNLQLPTSISDTNWLISRLNTTAPKIISVQSPRCLILDTFGYLLTLEAVSGITFMNRYDRTNLDLIQHIALQMLYTSIGMLSYFNGMIFISPNYNSISIFDHVNFTLLGVINCGSNIIQPRDIIYIENQKMLIITSQSTLTLFFVQFNSPTNYTCLNSLALPGQPQGLLKVDDTFFYMAMSDNKCVYSFHFDGVVWIQSLFVNVTQTVGSSSIYLGHVHIDDLERRWVVVVGFGLIIYDEWGSFLGMWKFGNQPYDIYISNDYRLIVSDYGNSALSLYEPSFIL